MFGHPSEMRFFNQQVRVGLFHSWALILRGSSECLTQERHLLGFEPGHIDIDEKRLQQGITKDPVIQAFDGSFDGSFTPELLIDGWRFKCGSWGSIH